MLHREHTIKELPEEDDNVFLENSDETLQASTVPTTNKEKEPEAFKLPKITQETDPNVAINNSVKNSSTEDDSQPALTKEQIREIKEAFTVFDSNGDGCISATEIKKLITSLGYTLTEAELMDMMNMMDSDGNGAIDFPEFLEITSRNLHNTDQEDSVIEAFQVFDRDNSGHIGRSEIEKIMKILGQEFKEYEIDAMIKAADLDGDGVINLDDFMKLMSSESNNTEK